MRCFIIFSFAAGLASGAPAQEGPKLSLEARLSFARSGAEVARLSLRELLEKVKPRKVRFYDPRHGKVKSYRCLAIRDVMDAGFGRGWDGGPHTEAVLTALDGYASVSAARKLAEDGGCLAFEDLDVPGWEPIGRKRANPGPFYLLWTNEEQSTENEYPWPWQLAQISLVRFEERYPEVVPAGAAPDSKAFRGYLLFRGQCLRCHSMNQQGGKIGPDLNAPQSVTSYRPKKMIKAFIRQPSWFRHTEMPDHAHLSEGDLEDLYLYLKFMSRRSPGPPKKG